MPGLVITLSGSAAGYEAMLARSVKQAEVANAKIQVAFESRRQYATAKGLAAGGPIGAAELAVWRKGQQEWNKIQAEQTATMLANFATQRAAAIANAEAIVAAGAAGRGGGGHGPAGMTGIIRESLVIIREISMGRGLGRIGGSVTLLAQYLGVLGLAVKSTAATQVLAARAAEKLNVQLAAQALAAKGTAAESELLAASQAQAAVTAEALKDEELALATATVSLNAVFFIVAGLIAVVGAGAFFLWRHFHNAAVAAKNWADAMNPLRKSFTELADAEEKAARARQEHADEIKKITDMHKSESDQIERKIKLLKMEAEARGWSDEETLNRQKELLETERDRLQTEVKQAEAASQSAAAKAESGATIMDSDGNVISLDDENSELQRLKGIADAAQAKMNQTTIGGIVGHAGDALNWMTDLVGFNANAPTTRPADKNDVLDFEVNGTPYQKTFSEVKAAFDEAAAKVRKLTVDQTTLDNVYKNSLSTQTDKQNALNKVIDDLADINDRQMFPSKRHGAAGRTDITERERIGLGAASSIQVSLLEYTKQSAQYNGITANSLQRIEQYMKNNEGAFD